MILYHATTLKKAKLYRETGYIKAPVRGFSTPMAAMAWAMKTGRTIIYEFESFDVHKMDSHHNKFGDAYWTEYNVDTFLCFYSVL